MRFFCYCFLEVFVEISYLVGNDLSRWEIIKIGSNIA